MFRCVLHLGLCTQVVDLNHVSVLSLQKVDQVAAFVPVEGLNPGGWETSSYNVLGDIGHIQVDVSVADLSLFPSHAASKTVAVEAG